MLSRKGIDGALSLLVTIFLFNLVGCSEGQTNNEEAHAISWYPGFTMPELLAANVDIEKREDLAALLSKDWYASIDVANTRSAEEDAFSNCQEYFREATPKTRTLREHEMNAFVELAVMCRATELMVGAKTPRKSYIPEDILTASSPEKFPSEIAFETSKTESEKNRNDPLVKHWGDINKIREVNAVSPYAVDFYTMGGVQRLELVGRGDFDGDGVEDVLLSSRDSVDGGSYQHLRLFVLSVDADGDWRTIKSYQ
ncbi:hypothetical protein [Marinimicrobium agarilyticum]|uniref:hypothetical protein n=1 Tax=Marinimicrobium agarilyticum TaxID=306546 RepID=UPI000482F17A|nr:hypothetical protein [Marinimicrobium agarilyticum]